ncbi:MAG: response regulator [Puniceicoccales bacterium]|jgi:CheY-like chemotaxis protein|nr:response regulator [Puniceicoccales bacterium]
MPDTILIADDEFEIRTIWEDRLKTAGYAVKSAKNKADVLEKFFGLNTKTETASKQGTYALVLLDIRMPSSATSR